MAAGAIGYAGAKSIKVKLTGDLDLDIARVRAIRAARPDVWLGVDGNQGFVIDQLDELVAALRSSRFRCWSSRSLEAANPNFTAIRSPVPIAGDESLLTLDDVAGAVGCFDVVNIKLDKCGGLTEGLLMADEARRLGLGVMVGNMVGSSLAMAPAFVLGQGCDIVDLDGPTFLAEDRTPSVVYEAGNDHCRPRSLGLGPGAGRMSQEPTWFGQPRGLTVLFLTNMWEQFSYFGMRALLVYYMTKQLLIGQAQSSFIYGTYTALAYFTPIVGGVIADRYLGKRKAVIIGASIMALGHFMMASEALFYAALAAIALGNGLFLPSLPSQVGDLYKRDDPRRGWAFNIYYVGINIGGFLAPLICGTLGELYGWHYGFGAAGIGMVAGLADLPRRPEASAARAAAPSCCE